MPGSSAGLRLAVVTIRPRTLNDWASQRCARSASSVSRWSSSRTLAWRRSKYSAVPKASTVTASATVYQKVSRRRMVAMSGLYDVPDAANGVHQLMGLSGVHLLAQSVDHHIHNVGAGVEVIVPGVLGNQRAGHYPAGVPHEILQHGVLLGRELDPLPTPPDLPSLTVQLQVTHLQHRRADLFGPAAQSLHPREQLLEGEWLGHIVVRTGAQRLHLEVHRVLGGQHQHRRGVSPVAQSPQHLQAVHLRQPEVQYDQIVASARRQSQPFPAVFHQVGVIALLLQTAFDVLAHGAVVFHHQDFHGWTGRNTRKVDPRPGWLSTSIRPRWSSTMP